MTLPEIFALITLPIRSSTDLLHATLHWFLERGAPLELAMPLTLGVIFGPVLLILFLLDRHIEKHKQGGAQ